MFVRREEDTVKKGEKKEREKKRKGAKGKRKSRRRRRRRRRRRNGVYTRIYTADAFEHECFIFQSLLPRGEASRGSRSR
jgi:hypothetical protein